MVCDDSCEPPIFARAGAVRWISKKVVMNGAETWAAFVKYGSADAPKEFLSKFGNIVSVHFQGAL